MKPAEISGSSMFMIMGRKPYQKFEILDFTHDLEEWKHEYASNNPIQVWEEIKILKVESVKSESIENLLKR